jgi:predicted ATPase
MPTELPTGTVTFLFTDIEGSTRLLDAMGTEAYADALEEHRRVLRQAFDGHGGVEVDTEGDAFFVAFPDAGRALEAASDAQEALADGPIKVRMGLHTGTPHVTRHGYVGHDVHKAARIAASAHGGQVVLSKETREHLDDGPELVDLGEHRVKDFVEPIWIYQLGTGRFPPLKTISNTNLPRPASSFVGREREVAEISALLRDGARLLTLTGPGGTGKTRLAIESAAELVASFANGTFWVPLAALRDPALVTETIAQTIGAKGSLAEHIGEREMLLLIDNLEQVVAAAPELATLVEACPNLRLLATSRERLRVRGESEYAVPPLSDVEAVELFCARSQLPPDDVIADLCRRLDDLPLAVELAAARASVLSPAEISERLSKRLDLLRGGRDVEARQATLRATIEWSHDLLSPAEQTLFARLAVFRGGFTLEAAEQVAEADLDVLAPLVDKSLLRRTDKRFAMLETIREFAAQRLEAGGEADELRQRHADYFLGLAEEAFPNLKGDPKDWLDRLEADHDNLRAALDRFESAGQSQESLQLAGALYRFWYMHGHFREGDERLERLLRSDPRPTAVRARALHGAAVMAGVSGDSTRDRKRAEEARDLCRHLGDEWGEAYAKYLIANSMADEKRWAEALPIFESSLEEFRRLGDAHYSLVAGDAVAWMAGNLGDTPRRRQLHEEVLAVARATGDDMVAALQLEQLATIALEEDGRPDVALDIAREAIQVARRAGQPTLVVEALTAVIRALSRSGEAPTAARLLGAAARLRDEMGGSSAWVGEVIEEQRAALRNELGDEPFEAAWEDGRRLSTDAAVALALDETDTDA